MFIEIDRLRDRLRAEKIIVKRELRAGFEAAAAGHATRQAVTQFLRFLRFTWPGAQTRQAVGRHPTFDLLEVFEHALTVDPKVADDGELTHRFKHDLVGIFQQFVDQRGTTLTNAAVDDHGACAADFFEAAAVPDDRRRLAAVGRLRMFGDVLQHADDVQVRSMLATICSSLCAG